MNRATHGLFARAFVMPGERRADYQRNLRDWFTTLPCTTRGEAVVVAQLADVSWRTERLLRVEHAHRLKLLEDAMRKTPKFSSQALALRALTGVNALVVHAEAASSLVPFPANEVGLRAFLDGAQGVVALVDDVDGLDPRSARALAASVKELTQEAEQGSATSADMKAVALAALDAQRHLAKRVKKGRAALSRLQDKMAAEMVPSDDRESRRLARYRVELERSQARLLGVLDQVRTQSRVAGTSAEESPDRPVRVNLRVV